MIPMTLDIYIYIYIYRKDQESRIYTCMNFDLYM
jgi:hypothetical protein